jgi:Na+/H+ antiporter NhaC
MNLKLKILLIFAALVFSATNLFSEPSRVKSVEINTEFAIIDGMISKVELTALDSSGSVTEINCMATVQVNKSKIDVYFVDGKAEFDYVFSDKSEIIIECDTITSSKVIRPVPLWFSIIPPLIAILFALIFKEVFSALFLGLFSGTFIIYLYSGAGAFAAFFKGLFAIPDTYIVQALSEPTHVSIIVFSMLIGGTVHIITKNGGMQGVINYLAKYAKSPRSGQLVTWFLGLVIFFDDYANTLVVGNTMRPVTDKLKISREKLAYLVDSTAAPVAAIAFVTTWIGAELSYIQSSVIDLGLEVSAYNIFFASLKYAFYPILTLIFVLMLIIMKRDFGSMYKAEMRAREKGVNAADMEKKIQSDLRDFEIGEHAVPRAFNALIPVGVIIFGTIAGLIYTGWDTKIWNDSSLDFLTKLSGIIGNSDSYKALIWASLGGLLSAVFLSVVQRNLSLRDSMDSMVSGFKTMLTAILILTLAWSLAGLVSDLHTADFITMAISSAEISPYFLPAITFIVSALISFSTGSSWGTMAIMYPLILPATWLLCQQNGMTHDESLAVFAHVVSTVIAGSVFGDHCSPISDTTILSSLASSCNHIQHVRTQLPYAVSVAAVSIFLGTLPVSFGVSHLIVFPVSIVALWLIIRFVGKKTENTQQNLL